MSGRTTRLTLALAGVALAVVILGVGLVAMGGKSDPEEARIRSEPSYHGTLEMSTRVRDTDYVVWHPSSKNSFDFYSGPDGHYAVVATTWKHNTIKELGGLLAPREVQMPAERTGYTTGPSPLLLVVSIEPNTWYRWTVYPLWDQLITYLEFEAGIQVFDTHPGSAVLPDFGVVVTSSVVGAALVAGTGVLVARFAWFFYCRLRPGALLENANRSRLLETARARPGLSLREVAREAGVSKTTAQYHLRMLARFGFLLLVKEAQDSRVVRVFPLNGDARFAQDPRARKLTVALSHEPCRRLAKTLLDRALGASPEDASISLAEAARVTGLPKPTAFRHLRALARAGALDIHGQTPHTRRYSLTPGGLRNLQAMPFPLAPAPPRADPSSEPAPSGTSA